MEFAHKIINVIVLSTIMENFVKQIVQIIVIIEENAFKI